MRRSTFPPVAIVVLTLSSLLSAACSNDQAKEAEAPLRQNAAARSSLNPHDQELLPQHGFVFFGGGFVSSPTRLTVDFDAATLSTVKNDPGQASTGVAGHLRPLKKMKRHLTGAELADARAQAEAVWSSTENFMNRPPIADFDARLILGDGRSARDIDAYGPPVGIVGQLFDSMWKLTELPGKTP